MRIVNLETFLTLPIGTVFSKYGPRMFEGLMIKHESISISNDFMYFNLIGNVESHDCGTFFDRCKEMEEGESRCLDFDVLERDGLFKKDQLFAVYQNDDVEGLIGALNILTAVEAKGEK